jgi:hypothetical protein
MTALEHQLNSRRQGIENRLRGTGQDQSMKDFMFLGDYVAGGSPKDGFNPNVRYPIIIPQEYWKNHAHILGATRSGKTAYFLSPFVDQKIRENRGPVIVLDLKGDDAMFHATRRRAEEEGRKFLWYTNVPWFSSYLFNPWDQDPLRRISLPQLAQTYLNMWNLWYGFDYGKSFYSAQSRAALTEALKFRRSGEVAPNGMPLWAPSDETRRITSFKDAYEAVRAIRGNPEYGGAHSLLMVLQDLANIKQLDFAGAHPEAVRNSIRVSDLLRPDENGKYPVVYFYLRSCTELVAVSQVAKMLMHTLFLAQVQAIDFYKLGRTSVEPPEEIFIGIDEFQNCSDSAIRNILEQGSGYGLHFCLANQDLGQLRQHDLVETVMENCGNRVMFTLRDTDLQDRIIKLSGEKTIHKASYTISHDAYKAGQVDERYAVQVMNGAFKGVDIIQERGPRFDRNLLNEVSNHPSRCIYIPPQAAAGVDFGGYPVVVDCSFHLTEDEFNHFKDKEPWPEATEETIVADELDDKPRSPTNGQSKVEAPAPTKRVVDPIDPSAGNSGEKGKTS